MATPIVPSKRFYAAAGVKGAAWGTALPVVAAGGLLITKSGLALKQKYVPNEEIDQVELRGGSVGPQDAPDFPIDFFMRYSPGLLGSYIAGLFGLAGTPATGGATSKVHTFKWADEYSNFFTHVEERPGAIWEVPSAVPYKLSFKFTNGFLMATISLRGCSLTNASAINTDTQMTAITYVDTGNRVKFMPVVWMNAGAGALQSSDAIICSDIEVDYERPIDSIPAVGADGIGQPKQPGFSKWTVKLKLPRADATNVAYLSTIFQAAAPQKMTLTFTGSLIETSHYYQMVLGFTRLVLMEPPPVPLEDMIATSLVFEGQESATAPTGMPAANLRPYITLENLQTTDYLV